MEKNKVKFLEKLTDLQAINVIGFILLVLNINFGMKELFIPIAVLFAITVFTGIRLRKLEGIESKHYKVLRLIINSFLFIGLCIYGYLA